MSAVALRLMTPADADAVAALHAASWRVAYRGIYSDAYLDHEVEQERQGVWREKLQGAEPGANWGLVAEDESGRLAGFIYVMPGHDPVWGDYINNLHVEPMLKGGGLGRRLMQAAAQRLADTGPARPIYLWVLDANEPAKRFYARLGAEFAERQLSDPLAGERHPVWRCVWRDPTHLFDHAD